MAICRQIGDKWPSKTLFLEIFDPRLSIAKCIFDCRISGVYLQTIQIVEGKTYGLVHVILVQISYFGKNVVYWYKSGILAKLSYFCTNLVFWHKSCILVQISYFGTNLVFWYNLVF